MNAISLLSPVPGVSPTALSAAEFAREMLRGRIAHSAPVLADGQILSAKEALLFLCESSSTQHPSGTQHPLAGTMAATPQAKTLRAS